MKQLMDDGLCYPVPQPDRTVRTLNLNLNTLPHQLH